jgi:hypothetical protein
MTEILSKVTVYAPSKSADVYVHSVAGRFSNRPYRVGFDCGGFAEKITRGGRFSNS